MARANFAAALVGGQLTIDHSDPGLEKLVERHNIPTHEKGQAKLRPAIEWFGELLFGGLSREAVADVERLAGGKLPASLSPLSAAVLILLNRPEAQLG